MHNPAAADVHAMMLVSTTRSRQVGAECRFLLKSKLRPDHCHVLHFTQGTRRAYFRVESAIFQPQPGLRRSEIEAQLVARMLLLDAASDAMRRGGPESTRKGV